MALPPLRCGGRGVRDYESDFGVDGDELVDELEPELEEESDFDAESDFDELELESVLLLLRRDGLSVR